MTFPFFNWSLIGGINKLWMDVVAGGQFYQQVINLPRYPTSTFTYLISLQFIDTLLRLWKWKFSSLQA